MIGSAASLPKRANSDAPGPRSILVLKKTWAVLDSFTGPDAELTLKQVRDRCGFPASTTSRLVSNLVDEGLLDRRDEFYRIGSRVLSWSESARRALDLVPLVTPVLKRLRDTTGESAALYQCRGLERVCVAIAETRHAVIWQLHIGMTTPLHVGSGGRALLAFDPALFETVKSRSLESYTQRTLSDIERLTQALAETRRIGAAVSIEELTTGVAGVSSVVIGTDQNVIASLGVAGPVQRFQPADIRRYVPAVVDAAHEASRLMGGELPVPS